MRAWLDSRVLRIAAGVLCLALGVLVLGRPFASLALLVVGVAATLVVLGVRELVVEDARRPWPPRLAAGCCFVAALTVLVAPAFSFRTLVIALGVWLVVEGLVRLVSARSDETDGRLATILFGASSTILGVLALRWPDITLTVAALVVGVRVLWLGLTMLWSARHASPAGPPTDSRARRVGRVGLAALSLVLTIVLAGASYSLHAAAPRPDAFYAAPDDPPAEPGQLLRVEPFTRAVPAGATGWRILYTTTRDDGVPALASALVVAPADPTAGPRPVLAWAHGTTGFAQGCAPSLLDDPFEAGAMPALEPVLDAGWVVVATDYVGLGTEGPHPYLIGQGEGRSVLDSVRAARRLDEVDLDGETVVWGHSQGGHAALWSGILAPTYAPDAGVVAVAALAPAADLPALVNDLEDVSVGALFASYVVAAYDATFDDVRAHDIVRPGARIQVEEMAERCLSEPSVLVSVMQSVLFDQSIFSGDPTQGPTGARLADNVPSGPIGVPLLVAQGETDDLVRPDAQAAYVQRRCGDGGTVDYRTYPGRDHLSLVADDSALVAELVAWTRDRFDGVAVVATCP